MEFIGLIKSIGVFRIYLYEIAADDDYDMFLHHYIVDKVSRVQKTGLSLHNTMLGSELFVQFVQIYPHHDSPFCSVYANLSITHFCTYDVVFLCNVYE